LYGFFFAFVHVIHAERLDITCVNVK
jgi:hypothetical protein